MRCFIDHGEVACIVKGVCCGAAGLLCMRFTNLASMPLLALVSAPYAHSQWGLKDGDSCNGLHFDLVLL